MQKPECWKVEREKQRMRDAKERWYETLTKE
jgi:hypothetical protein